MSYQEIAAWVTLGLSTSTVGFLLMLEHGLFAVIAVGLGLYVASLGLFVGIEESIRRSRDKIGDETTREPSADSASAE